MASLTEIPEHVPCTHDDVLTALRILSGAAPLQADALLSGIVSMTWYEILSSSISPTAGEMKDAAIEVASKETEFAVAQIVEAIQSRRARRLSDFGGQGAIDALAGPFDANSFREWQSHVIKLGRAVRTGVLRKQDLERSGAGR